MARRTTTVEDIPDPKEAPREPDTEQPTPLDLDREEALAGWIEELAGQDHAKISVYRIREKDNVPVFIESFGPEQVQADDFFRVLRHEYGGGKFRIQTKIQGRIHRQQTVNVEPMPKPPPGGPFGGMDVAAVIRELRGEQQNDTSQILQLIQQQQAQFQDLMIRMLESGRRDTGPTMGDLLDQLSTAKGLFTPAQPQESPTELLLKGIELAREFQSGDKETNFYDVLARSMSSFSGTLDKAMRLSPPPAQPGNVGPRPHPQSIQAAGARPAPRETPGESPPSEPGTAAPAAGEAAQEPPADAALQQYEGFVQWLVMLAAADKDPEIYANVVLDQMGDEAARAVFCDAATWSSVWAAFPVAHPYERWFGELREWIDGLTAPDDDPGHVAAPESSAETERPAAGNGAPAGDPERAPGDRTDVIDHGAPRQPGESGAPDP